jgi:hypothetical protein
MTDMLSPHFSLSELTHSDTATRKGINNTPPPAAMSALLRTATGLEGVRALLGVPVLVSSGFRCRELNELVGGQPLSQHTLGQAADFTAPLYGDPEKIAVRLIKSGLAFDQLLVEFGRWVHCSFTATPRRQALVIDHSGTRLFTIPEVA